MKKFKKIIAMVCAAVMAMSVMSIGVFAKDISVDITAKQELTIVDGMIDYSIYDSDMVYIQEHADKVAEFNAALKTRAAQASTYAQWNWSNGIYSITSGHAAGITISSYFVPTTTSMYFNAEVDGENSKPYMTVNKLNNDGSLTYVGSYNITSNGDGTYTWNNYKRALSKGQKYVFGFWGSTNWNSASFDIYKSAM